MGTSSIVFLSNKETYVHSHRGKTIIFYIIQKFYSSTEYIAEIDWHFRTKISSTKMIGALNMENLSSKSRMLFLITYVNLSKFLITYHVMIAVRKNFIHTTLYDHRWCILCKYMYVMPIYSWQCHWL